LEERLARFEQQPAAVLFPSGYAANVGTLSALLGPDDIVFCDRFNHASLIDGCRLSGAKLRVYRHDDLDGLRRALDSTGGARRRAIVTDSVFSMDGDVAPLRDLCDLAEPFDAMLIVDEAHATGVFGAHGRGVAEEQGVESRPMLRIGTLSKAIGAIGGFVTGSAELCDWLWNTARPQMFSTALPSSACAAAVAAIDVIESEPQRRVRLREASRRLVTQLREAGLNVPSGVKSPIVPVLVGDPERCLTAGQRLVEHGLLIAAIRPPTVPLGTSRLRISLSSAHGQPELETLIAAVCDVLQAPTSVSA
jgi:8-amino-7-oxononanoate synthase